MAIALVVLALSVARKMPMSKSSIVKKMFNKRANHSMESLLNPPFDLLFGIVVDSDFHVVPSK